MHRLMRSVAFTVAIAATSVCYGQDQRNNVIYIGGGSAKAAGPLESNKTPLSFGYLWAPSSTGAAFGFDIGLEGTKLDSTWGMTRAVKQATSYNLLVGTRLAGTTDARLYGAFILGAREKTASCPSSYLGYQCYADTKPTISYAGNFGAMLAFTYGSVMLGVRATGESTQGTVGLRF